MTYLAVIIPAAGAGRRMRGRDKLLEQIDGVALLARGVRRAEAVATQVIVTLPEAAAERHACLFGTTATVCEVSDASEGMAASIRTGMAALRGTCDAVMILPADMPDITIKDMKQMLAQFAEHDGQMICRGHSECGRAGHPVIFPPDCFAALATLTGDQGGRNILRQHAQRVVKVGLPADHAITDLDTPEAWEKWRYARGKP